MLLPVVGSCTFTMAEPLWLATNLLFTTRTTFDLDEVNSNNMELLADTQYWYNNLKDGCEKARKMFPGLEFDIKMPYREIEYDRFYNEIESSEPEPEKNESNGFYQPQFNKE